MSKLVKCGNCEERFDPRKLDRCPECGTHYLPQRSNKGVVIHQHALGYGQCDWRSEERCHYPGTMSSGTTGEGAWYCSGHFACSNPVLGADIVKASQDYQHPGRDEQDAKVQEEAAQYCERRGWHTVVDMRAAITKLEVNLLRKGPANVAWAQAIVDRIDRGEKLPLMSEKLAREALGLAEKAASDDAPLRQPGEDAVEAVA